MKRYLQISALIALAVLIIGCSGRKFIMSEGEINEIPKIGETEEYTLIWCDFHPILLMSEGIGARHDLHLQDERIFSGIKVVGRDQMVKLMVILPANVDLSSARGIISSRSGKHFYSLNGKDAFSQNGYLIPKFSWLEIEPLDNSGVKIEKVEINSERNKEVQEILTNIGKSLDKQEIPGLFDRVMSRVAKITTQDIFLAGATDFTSLFGIFGVRIWAIVEAVIQKADLSLPFYDTALVDRFQLGLALDPIQKRISEIESGTSGEILPLIRQWEKEMMDYEERRKEYELDREKWLKEKAKCDQ